jgi:hypothetical protein
MKNISKNKAYGLLVVWVVAGTAAGIYLTKILLTPKHQEFIAPLAEFRQCGPTAITTPEENKIIAKWSFHSDKLPADAKSALARNIKAIPDGALKALERRRLQLALDRRESSYTCSIYDKPGSKPGAPAILLRSAENCLRATGKDSTALVLGAPHLVMPDGKPRRFSEKNMIDEVTLPTVFWSLLEGLYQPSDLSIPNPAQDKPSIANISRQIKRYVVDGYQFDPAEKNYYLRTFGAAGTETPSFITRTLVLTAANLYCSSESFARLQKQQPEATKRFMSIYGCALGKPWHMADTEFVGLCPNLAQSN